MDDQTFWGSSLEFLFGQLERYREMNEKANKNTPKRKNQIEKNERIEKQSFRKLSPQEIAELRAKVGK